MPADPVNVLADHVRSLAGAPPGREASDRELLHGFAARRDEAAFAALVRRHGPMVLRVCRRALANAADAEDVFQATFLVLARKASSPRWHDSVANWLYGVAYRLARKVREAAVRRAARESRAAVRIGDDPLAAITGRELLGALDEELLRLPERYREPLVLCYLEGLARDEAAAQLGCPLGTLKERLGRGRDLLRRALTRRGVGAGAALAAALAAGRGSAAVPALLLHTTLRAARTGAGATAAVTALADGAASSAFPTKWVLAAALLLAGLVSAGVAVAVRQPPAATPPPSADKDKPEAPPAVEGAPRADALDDPLPDGVLLRLGSLRLRHQGTLRSVAFARGGQALVSGGWERDLQVWDPASGRELRRIEGPMGGVEAVAVSPDGKTLAGAADGYVFLLDVESGEEVRRLEGHAGRVHALAFSRKGDLLATGDKGAVRLWDAATGKALRAFAIGDQVVSAVAFSPDGRRVAAGCGDSKARVWDADGDKPLHTFTHNGSVGGVAFSGDGKTLAVVGNGTHFWDLATGKEVAHAAAKVGRGSAAAFSPDGKTLALGTEDGDVSLWDWAAGKQLWHADAHPDRVHTLAFSPDGKALASASAEESIQLWDAATGKSLDPTPGHRQRVRAVAYAADGRSVATAAWDGTVRLWDAGTGRLRRTFALPPRRPSQWDHQLNDVALSPDGKYVAAAGQEEVVRVWDAATGEEVYHVRGNCVAFAPDGKLLAVGGRGQGDDLNKGEVRLHEAATGKPVRALRGHLTPVAAVTFSADGTTLVSTGNVFFGRYGEPGENEKRFVRFWDVASGREQRGAGLPASLTEMRAGHVTLSPDGRTLAGTTQLGKTIQLWETASGQRRAELTGHTDMVFAAAYAPDGRTVASAGMDGSVRLWDALSGKEVARLEDHRGWVLSVAFSPDGTRLLTGGLDTTALIWDVARYTQRKPVHADLKAEEVEAQWKALAGEAAPAYAAAAKLVAAPARSVPLLRERMRPVAPPGEREVAKLLAGLDSDDFDQREKATAALEALNERAAPALRGALKDAKPEAKRRLQALLDKLDEARPTADQLRDVRAVEVLEYVGGDEARRVLEALAKGMPEARLTRAARAALERMK